MTPILTARELAVGYGGKPIVSSVDIAFEPGSVTALVGPNGCGKSTLLRTLAGLLPALGGHVEINGRALTSHTRRELSRAVAFLPQSPLVPAGVTAYDLVRHGRYAHRGPLSRYTAEDHEAIAWALEVTDTAQFRDSRLDELSGGERQRVWIATVLAERADVLLLDEPTTYLDLRHQVEVLDVVRRLAREHDIAVGLVLHDLGQAAAYGDQMMMLAGGAVVAGGDRLDVLHTDNIRRAFGLDVSVVRDEASGQVACIPTSAVPA